MSFVTKASFHQYGNMQNIVIVLVVIIINKYSSHLLLGCNHQLKYQNNCWKLLYCNIDGKK